MCPLDGEQVRMAIQIIVEKEHAGSQVAESAPMARTTPSSLNATPAASPSSLTVPSRWLWRINAAEPDQMLRRNRQNGGRQELSSRRKQG